MQEIDSESLKNQRERRKRVLRIRNAIMFVVAGWILISVILIICLFAQTISLNNRLNRLSKELKGYRQTTSGEVTSGESGTQVSASGEAAQDTQDAEASATGTWEPVTPPAVGISEEDNQAVSGELCRVYLTFDDGPSDHTAEILDKLNHYGVKATFFVTGREDEESKALYKRIVDEGHTLGMHSYSNKYSLLYQSQEAFEADFHALQDYLYEVTGVKSQYYRFPGGSSNQISNVPMANFIHFLNTQGVIYCDWNVSAGDAAANAYTAEEMIANVTEDVVKYKTSVVLLHDASDKQTTVEMLGPLIEALQGMNTQILAIDENASVIQYVKADSVEQ